MGRVLGIDHGDVRIGIAMSDETAFLASPLTTIQSGKSAIDEIVALLIKHGVEKIVIGLPRNMDGSYGPATEKVRAFEEKLKTKTDVPVFEWDERLSTVSAHNALREAGLDGKKRKGVVDKVAAQIILQNYLDARM
ncbi:MAG: putative pre6S rRNA nuclease [Verrucomicrobiota bacterium]|jgi:putative Holliday junction resolvase|nr:putative pre6S rRNA nuclease [Verrucomicrobiota bacterium]MDK2963216.1 putative pre6S rRNA nuclease [Verrucomicrobiota bacterium]